MEDPVVYVERSKSGLLMVKDLEFEGEYYPCDRDDDEGVYISNYDYYFIRRESDILAFVEESVTPKYWDHEYISPKLYIKCIKKAAQKHKRVEKIIDESLEPEAIRVLYALTAFKDYNGKESVTEVIQDIEATTDEIRKEAEVIAKRELLKYINK